MRNIRPPALVAAACAVVLGGVVALPAEGPAAPATTAAPARLWGVTLDDVTHAAAIARSLRSLPERPVARVVLDPGMGPSSYAAVLRRIHRVADVMGQPVDSSETASYTVAAYRRRAPTPPFAR